MTFSFGKEFMIQIFGESHGERVGVVVEGCPPGLVIEKDMIQKELDRRHPGSSDLVSPRSETDTLHIHSGVFNGTATGAPITMSVLNLDVDSSSYEEIRHTPRPGHADYTARIKYGGHNDYRGGGFFSGRMTAALVMAGAIAKLILNPIGIEVTTHITKIGSVMNNIDSPEVLENEITQARAEGDSVGGIIECSITGVTSGLGEPFFDSVESVISHAIFSIPGVKGIEFGSGFKCASMRGSENNDTPIITNGTLTWASNNAGGILGGITNGAPIVFRTAIKPTSSIAKTQSSVDLEKMKKTSIQIRGRHDPCIVPRVLPVIEAMSAIVMVDLLKRHSNLNPWI